MTVVNVTDEQMKTVRLALKKRLGNTPWKIMPDLPEGEGEYLVIFGDRRNGFKRGVLKRRETSQPGEMLDVIDGLFAWDQEPAILWTEMPEIPLSMEIKK